MSSPTPPPGYGPQDPWPLWDEKRQTLADKINNTYVIKL